MHVYMYIYIYMYVCVYIYVMDTYLWWLGCVASRHNQACTCVYVHVYLSIYIYIYICVYVYVIYTYLCWAKASELMCVESRHNHVGLF